MKKISGFALAAVLALSVGLTGHACAADGSTVVIGVRNAAANLSYTSGNGKFHGYHVEICEKIAADYAKAVNNPGLVVKYRPVTSASRMNDIVSGAVDIECGSTSNIPDRRALADFLPTVYVLETRVAVADGSGIRSLQDLNGKSIGVLDGTSVIPALKDWLNNQGVFANLVYLSNPSDLAARLSSGNIDAVAVETDLLTVTLGRMERSDFKVRTVGPVVLKDPVGIMVSKNGGPFRDVAFRTMDTLIRSGEIEKIHKAWFGGDIPGPVKPLNTPPNESTLEAWNNYRNSK